MFYSLFKDMHRFFLCDVDLQDFSHQYPGQHFTTRLQNVGGKFLKKILISKLIFYLQNRLHAILLQEYCISTTGSNLCDVDMPKIWQLKINFF